MLRFLIAAPLIFLLTGCGTIANMSGKGDFYSVFPVEGNPPPTYYGGVMRASGWFECQDWPTDFTSWVMAADVVTCSMADTITLPVVFYERAKRQSAAPAGNY